MLLLIKFSLKKDIRYNFIWCHFILFEMLKVYLRREISVEIKTLYLNQLEYQLFHP